MKNVFSSDTIVNFSAHYKSIWINTLITSRNTLITSRKFVKFADKQINNFADIRKIRG